jgi:DNA-binding LacI/PurR family transcriptional regulator
MNAIETALATPALPPGLRQRRRRGSDQDANDGDRMTGIGLAIAAGNADDHFVAALAHALAEPLITAGMGLFTRVVHDEASEQGIYRHWAESDGVSGVALLGAGRDDPRIPMLRSLGLPFAAVVDAGEAPDFPAVLVDVSAAVENVRSFLDAGRHQRVVYIVGPTPSITSQSRAAALSEQFPVVRTDRSPSSAVAAATAALADGPAALLFDSDVHAAAALAAFAERGIRIPEDVSIVSWTDSSLCQSTSPSITAINRRGSEIGALLGERMLATIRGDAAVSVDAPHPFVVVRESA